MSYQVYVSLAMSGKLRANFDQWDMIAGNDKNNWTLAHVAAINDKLPDEFSHWNLRDSLGDTPAHLVLQHRSLPDDFNQWIMSNNFGWSVGHAAAEYGRVPNGFEYWATVDAKGVSVARIAAINHGFPDDFSQWDMRDSGSITGKTIAHIAAAHNNLPSNFSQWDLADIDGWTVAHEAAKYGYLPEGFNQWDLINKAGVSVRNLVDLITDTQTEYAKNTDNVVIYVHTPGQAGYVQLGESHTDCKLTAMPTDATVFTQDSDGFNKTISYIRSQEHTNYMVIPHSDALAGIK